MSAGRDDQEADAQEPDDGGEVRGAQKDRERSDCRRSSNRLNLKRIELFEEFEQLLRPQPFEMLE